MKLVAACLIGLLGLSAAIPVWASAPSSPTERPVKPRARISANGEQLQIRWRGQRVTINASDLNVRVLDAVDCDRLELADEQTLNGQRFFPGTVAINPEQGDVAVGVLLDQCVETDVSAVFVIDLQPAGAYAIYRVQVPGSDPINDDVSTYPLNSITAVGYLNNDLLVKQGDAAGSEALLVFEAANTPAGSYVGCLLTEQVEGDRLCPAE